MKIALIQCPAWGIQNPPLALSMLAAYMRSRGREVFLFDLNIRLFRNAKTEDKALWQLGNEEFWGDENKVAKLASDYKEEIDGFVDEILRTEAKIIGFSVFSSSKNASLLIAGRIKQRAHNKVTIFGGPHCFPHIQGPNIIREDAVDIMVIGEGEAVLDELVSQMEWEGRITSCDGAWLKINNKVVESGRRGLICDLNKLPFADFDDFELDLYGEPTRLPIYTSRGCPNRCVYCNENIYMSGYRTRSGERVFEEMKQQLRKHKRVTHFDFADQLINGNPKELALLADLIIKGGLKITWSGQAIIRNYMTFELLNKLRKSGCVCLAYGLESGSQKILDLMRKGFAINDAQRVIRDTHDAGIDVVTNFMFGFPGETEVDFSQSLDFIRQNKEYITTVNPSPVCTAIGIGSYLYEHADEFNVDLRKGHLFWTTKNEDNTYEIRRTRYKAFCELATALEIKLNA